jgi:hypothetical protein
MRLPAVLLQKRNFRNKYPFSIKKLEGRAIAALPFPFPDADGSCQEGQRLTEGQTKAVGGKALQRRVMMNTPTTVQRKFFIGSHDYRLKVCNNLLPLPHSPTSYMNDLELCQ